MDNLLNTDDTAVVVVDVQGDFTFFKKGALAVQNTDRSYVDNVICATENLKGKGYKIFATQDFHPENHVSFFTRHNNKAAYESIEIEGRTQVLWPPHCVMGTEKADILIDNRLFTAVIQKGTDPEYDSYSGFFDDGGTGTGLDDILKSYHVTTLIVYGLAMDYCVKATALDGVASGYKVILVEDLCRGVADDSSESALKEMKSAGIQVETYSSLALFLR